jgi:hypothetical protein
MSTELNFERVFGEKTSMEAFDNIDLRNANPSLELLDEARTVFGIHRRIGAFVSLGNGLSIQSILSTSKLVEGLPGPLFNKLHREAFAKEKVHIEVRDDCIPGTYFRFDTAEFRSLIYKTSVSGKRPLLSSRCRECIISKN